MDKSLKITYNTIVIIILNVLYFVCSYYPKHILEFSSWYSLVSCLFNLIFYVLLFSVIIIFFKKDKTVFSDQIFNSSAPFIEKFEIKTLLSLLVVQIIIDLLNTFSSVYFARYTCIVSSVLTLVGWLTIYAIVTRDKCKIKKFPKHSTITFAICLILLAISILSDVRILNTYTENTQKYVSDSIILQNATINLDFISGLKNFVFDTLIAIVLIISHFSTIDNEEDLSNRKGASFLIRVFILAVIAVLLINARALVFPHSLIKTINKSANTTKHHALDDSFYASSENFTISRASGYDTENNVFQKTKIKIYCNQVELSEVSINGIYKANDLGVSDNNIIIGEKFRQYEINGQPVFVMEGLAICYHEDAVPKVVKFSDINSHNENSILSEIIKELVAAGDVMLFVNSYEYLKENDFEFANSVAQRYMCADFTDNEKIYIDKIGYRIEYIQKLVND